MQVTSYGTDIALACFYTAIAAAIVVIFIVIGTQIGNGDNASKVASAIKWSYIAGIIIITLLLAIHVLTYKTTNEIIKTLMIYMTFIMAYMAMCISLINIKHT